MSSQIQTADLKKLFTKPYGVKAPSREKWAEFYEQDVVFIDPTQEKKGLNNYIDAQDKLVKRCDDIFLITHAISVTGKIGFVEWTMGDYLFNTIIPIIQPVIIKKYLIFAMTRVWEE